MREGWGNCLKYLKEGETEQRRRDTKIFKTGGKLCQGMGALKGGGGGVGWNPLLNYEVKMYITLEIFCFKSLRDILTY